MAVKKTATKREKVEIPEVEIVDTTPEVEPVDEPKDESVEMDEVSVKVEVEEKAIDEVEVEANAIEIDDSKQPRGNVNVKIRMRVDHKCTIAMVRYNLVAGKTYTVPENVKRILNKAGLLAPLN